jgi:hypothetical protein
MKTLILFIFAISSFSVLAASGVTVECWRPCNSGSYQVTCHSTSDPAACCKIFHDSCEDSSAANQFTINGPGTGNPLNGFGMKSDNSSPGLAAPGSNCGSIKSKRSCNQTEGCKWKKRKNKCGRDNSTSGTSDAGVSL